MSGRPFVIGFFRGLHCPFCRRQLEQLASVQPTLRAAGVETVAVINTPVERARLYFRHRPTPITLLCDPDCRTHQAYGVPHGEFLPEGSCEQPEWPYGATMAQFQAARINPTGELPEPLHPMEANTVLNAKDGFELDEADNAISRTTLPSSSGTSGQCERHHRLGTNRGARRTEQPLHLPDRGGDHRRCWQPWTLTCSEPVRQRWRTRQSGKIIRLDGPQPLFGFRVEQMQFAKVWGNDDLVAGAEIKALSYRRNELIGAELRGYTDLGTSRLDEDDLSGNRSLSDCKMLRANAVNEPCAAVQ